MKPRDRTLALKAGRMVRRRIPLSPGTIAMKLKLDCGTALALANKGVLIEQCEGYRLTENEAIVLAALARLEARRVHHGGGLASIGQVDFAASKRSGWTGRVIQKRLRTARPSDAGVRDITNRLGFVTFPEDAGAIWLTPSGWAFVWATGLILKNWKVPG